jgi:hypothetical protein
MTRKCETEWRPEYDRDYSSVRDGMFVCDADGEMIGKVEKIFVAPDNETAQLLVKGTEEIKREYIVPIEAIKAVDRDNLFLDCSSRECTSGDRDKRPSGEWETTAIYLRPAEDSPDIYPNQVRSESHTSEEERQGGFLCPRGSRDPGPGWPAREAEWAWLPC